MRTNPILHPTEEAAWDKGLAWTRVSYTPNFELFLVQMIEISADMEGPTKWGISAERRAACFRFLKQH